MLKKYDAVGVNLQKDIKTYCPLHYSGNFWWSKSNYICKLNPIVYYNYNAPEFWLTEKELGVYISLWNSNTHHYNDGYDKNNYVDKDIIIRNSTIDY